MRRLIALFLLVVGLPALSRAEVCTLSGAACTMTSLTAVTGTGCSWTTAGAPCASADSADSFVIPSGTALTRTSSTNITYAAGASGITVQSGGTFTLAPSNGRTQWTLADQGINCQEGSTCNFLGQYVQVGPASPATVSSRDNDPNVRWYVPTIVFCPGAGGAPDCNTGTQNQRVRFSYPAAPYDENSGAIGDANISQAIATLPAGTTTKAVWCSWDWNVASDSDIAQEPDHGHCYPIAATGADYFDLDIDENSTDNTNGYSLARTRTVGAPLFAAVSLGSRTVQFTCDAVNVVVPSCVLDTDGAGTYVGYWVRFADASGNVLSDPYLIQATSYAANVGTLTLADPRGTVAAYTTSERIYIDHMGFRSGDGGFVMSPINFLSASADQGDGGITVRGQHEIRGIYTNGLGAAPDGADTGGSIVVVSGSGSTRDVVIRGGFVGAGESGRKFGLTAPCDGARVEHVTYSGDPNGSCVGSCDGDPNSNTDHGFIVMECENAVLTDIYSRFLGDDMIFPQTTTVGLSVYRWGCEWMTDLNSSGGCIQGNAVSTDMLFRDGVVKKMTNEGLLNATGGTWTLEHTLVVGHGNTALENNATIGGTRFKGLLLVGGNGGLNLSFPNWVDQFVGWDNAMTQLFASPRNITNGLIARSTLTSYALALNAGIKVENLALIDTAIPAAKAIIQTNSGAQPAWHMRRLALLQTQGFTGATQWGMYQSGGTHTYSGDVFGDWVMSDLARGVTGSEQGIIWTAADWLGATHRGGYCLFNNTDNGGTILANWPAGVEIVRDRAPGFPDPQRWQVDLPVSSPCYGMGTRGAGLRTPAGQFRLPAINTSSGWGGGAGGGGGAARRAGPRSVP